MKNIVIFASGSGTNAERIAAYFAPKDDAKVSAIYCNKKNAYVLQRAQKRNIPARVFSKADFYETDTVYQELKELKADLIVLAGFLWLVPQNILNTWHNRIINIHPALLPKYGGKGMYGHYVHEAVIKNKEKESGISIHLVNERYDEGRILYQAQCPVMKNDSPDSLAERIHELEHKHYPIVIDEYLQQL